MRATSDGAVEAGVERPVHLPHPARAERARDLVGPEEAIEALQRLADFVAGLNLAAGFGGSLSPPILQAIDLLADGNPRNDMAACGALSAFRNQVENHLRFFLPSDAARLTQQPDVIGASLGCR